MSKRYGYGRVSSKGQEKNGNSLEDQKAKLEAANCDEIILETHTGTKMERPKFTKLLSKLKIDKIILAAKPCALSEIFAHRGK